MRRRFNVCLTSHSRRVEVETTSYVYRVKVKHRLLKIIDILKYINKASIENWQSDSGGHNF